MELKEYLDLIEASKAGNDSTWIYVSKEDENRVADELFAEGYKVSHMSEPGRPVRLQVSW